MAIRTTARPLELLIKFRGVVEPSGVEIPVAAIAALGARSHERVIVCLNGSTHRSVVSEVGDRSLVALSPAAGVRAGDIVDVELTLDPAPRQAPRVARQLDRRAVA